MTVENTAAQSMGNNLNTLIKNSGMKIHEISSILNIPRATIYHILSAASENPGIAIILKLADYFGVTLEYLLGRNNQPTTSSLHTIPLVHWNEVKDFKKDKNALEKQTGRFVQEKLNTHFNLFYLKNHPLLETIFSDKALLLIDMSREPEDGNYILWDCGNNNFTIRKYFSDNERGVIVHPVTNNVEKIKSSANIEGVVIRVILDMVE